jgi:hypothetical protein
MNTIVKIRVICRLILLLIIGLMMSGLAACKGGTTAPFGSTITIEKSGDAIYSGPTDTLHLATTKTQQYRVTVLDPSGLPMDGVDVHFQGQFTNGQSILFGGGSAGSAPVTLSAINTTENGILTFQITAPYIAQGVQISYPLNQSALAGTATGSLTDDTYSYVITSVDLAGESNSGGSISIPLSGVTNTFTGAGTGSVDLSWSKVAGATGYNVYGYNNTTSTAIGYLFTVVCPATGCSDPVTINDNGSNWPPNISVTPPGSTNTTGLGPNDVKGTMQATTGAAIATQDIDF